MPPQRQPSPPVRPVGKLSQPGQPSNPFMNQDSNVVNQRADAINLWKEAETVVKTGQNIDSEPSQGGALSAAALVMEKVEAFAKQGVEVAKQGVEAIESGAERVVETVEKVCL